MFAPSSAPYTLAWIGETHEGVLDHAMRCWESDCAIAFARPKSVVPEQTTLAVGSVRIQVKSKRLAKLKQLGGGVGTDSIARGFTYLEAFNFEADRASSAGSFIDGLVPLSMELIDSLMSFTQPTFVTMNFVNAKALARIGVLCELMPWPLYASNTENIWAECVYDYRFSCYLVIPPSLFGMSSSTSSVSAV